MVALKIEERTLYPSLVSYLQKIGFNAIQETKIKAIKETRPIVKHPDILFQITNQLLL